MKSGFVFRNCALFCYFPGDLGAIAKEYEVAICAVTGPFLDNIVVESVECSKRCMEHLRGANKGRATLLVLDQITRNAAVQPRFMDARREYPEKCQRLFDLVKIEDLTNYRLRAAFYYAMRDTLVAKDLEQADRVGNFKHERFRVVSLDGKIVEPSGKH